MSPRNSVEAICQMLDASSCKRIISQAVLNPLISQVQKRVESAGVTLRIDDLPTMQATFPRLYGIEEDGSSNHPYLTKQSSPSWGETTLYLHSSGSTGFPKSIPFSHRRFAQVMSESESPSLLHTVEIANWFQA
jgi:acyl-CoA synthetase (AMP-forming)/AMP-acid ligase II